MFLRISLFLLFLQASYFSLLNVQAATRGLSIETSYSLHTTGNQVETVLRKDHEQWKLIKEHIFPKAIESLEAMPYISNIVFVPGEESKLEYSWANYITKRRESYVYVNLDIASQVTFLFKVSEDLRECKVSIAQKDPSSVEDEEDSPCNIHSLKSEAVIEGPIAVYGNFVSNVDTQSLLKNKQSFTISAQTNYSKEFVFKTSFKILTSSFEESLVKFLDVFHIKSLMVGHFTRRQLLLGTARALRTFNEKVLSL